MEAYCNAVRALEDKLYDIELHHVPAGTTRRWTNSPRLHRSESPFPRMFLHETSRNRPSTSNHHPRAKRNPRGLPQIQRAQSPWTRTPRTRHLCSPCSRATAQTRPRPWRQRQPPHAEDWRAKYLTWMDRGELPPDRSEARRIARMAKSFTIVDGELYKRAASGVLQQCIPIPQGRELIRDIHAGVCVATTRHRVPLWATCSPRAFTGPPRSLTPARLYAPTKGVSFMPVRQISRLTPFKRFPSHGLSPCGGWTSSSPCERHPRATLTYWSSWISSLNGSRCAQSKPQGGASRVVLY
jgi:hypothetical protein